MEERQQAWEVYLTPWEDGDVASICLDMAALDERDPAAFRHLLLVKARLQNPREDGLHRSEENESLFALEDALHAALGDTLDAVYVGRVTADGEREFAYYAPKHLGFEEILDTVMEGFDYEFQFAHAEEPGWDYYHEILAPGPHDMQRIMNRGVIENLEKHGDVLETPRVVDHCLYFATAGGRDAFVAEVEPEGFRVQQTRDRDDEEHPCMLELGFTQPVDSDTVDAVVLDLAQRAERHDGRYDGWSCVIMKPEGEDEGESDEG